MVLMVGSYCVLILCKKKAGARSYSNLMDISFNENARLGLDIFSVVHFFGYCVACCIALRDQIVPSNESNCTELFV